MQFLDHERFQGAEVLADIGTKIAAGRAALLELESGKRDFLEGRAEEALGRVQTVLAQSRTLIDEIGKYHSELVGYRSQVDGFLADLLYLLQSVREWKAVFDKELAAQRADIDAKVQENNQVLERIAQARALLEGESEGIKTQRAALKQDARKITDEWASLARATKELTPKS